MPSLLSYEMSWKIGMAIHIFALVNLFEINFIHVVMV